MYWDRAPIVYQFQGLDDALAKSAFWALIGQLAIPVSVGWPLSVRTTVETDLDLPLLARFRQRINLTALSTPRFL